MVIRYIVAAGSLSSTSVWSASDGGAPGASVPSSSDTAKFTATSGSVSVSGSLDVGALDMTGFTGTWTMNSTTRVDGDITFGGTLLAGSSPFIVIDFTGTSHITSNGITLPCSLSIGNSFYPTIILADDFHTTGFISSLQGTLFDAATHNVNVTADGGVNFSVMNVNFGSGTWTLSGSNPFYLSYGPTYNSSSANFVINVTVDNTSIALNDGGLPLDLYDVTINGNGYASTFAQFSGSNVHNLTIGPGTDFQPLYSDTVNVGGAFTSNGTSGSPNSISTYDYVDQPYPATISQSSGTASAAYTTITNIIGTGGASFRAPTSSGNVDGGGNSGWNFSSPSTPNQGYIFG